MYKSPESFEYTQYKGIVFSLFTGHTRIEFKKWELPCISLSCEVFYFFNFLLFFRKLFCKQKWVKIESHKGTKERNSENVPCRTAVLLIASPTIKFWCLWKAGRATSSVIICLQAVGASEGRRQPAVWFLFLDFLFWHQLALKHLMCLTGRKDSNEMV